MTDQHTHMHAHRHTHTHTHHLVHFDTEYFQLHSWHVGLLSYNYREIKSTFWTTIIFVLNKIAITEYGVLGGKLSCKWKAFLLDMK